MLAICLVGAFVLGAIPANGAAPVTKHSVLDMPRAVLLNAANGDLNAMGVAYKMTPQGRVETPITLGDALNQMQAIVQDRDGLNVASPIYVGAGSTHTPLALGPFCDHASVFNFYIGSGKMKMNTVGPSTGSICGGYASTYATTGTATSQGTFITCGYADTVEPSGFVGGAYLCSFYGSAPTSWTFGGNMANGGFSFFGYTFDYAMGETASWVAQA